jgi:Transposase DDE domain
MLAFRGRAIPLAFWLQPMEMGGKGSQRAAEDRALLELKEWLPKRFKPVLVGDRGFRGISRMKLLEQMNFKFVLRITGRTEIKEGPFQQSPWHPLKSLRPEIGQRWQKTAVLLGKTGGGFRVNVAAVRQRLTSPKPQKTNKGKKTGQLAEETTWFLASNLSLSVDIVEIYAWRMQIEQTFRDYKSLFGMEQERTHRPHERLTALMWASMIAMALDVQQGDPEARVPQHMPRCSVNCTTAPSIQKPDYPAQSVTREGLHQFVVALIHGQLVSKHGQLPSKEVLVPKDALVSKGSPSAEPILAHRASGSPTERRQSEPPSLLLDLQSAHEKSSRMQCRPQVVGRRRPTPAPRNRLRTQPLPQDATTEARAHSEAFDKIAA